MKIKFPKIPKIPRPPKNSLSVTTAMCSLVSCRHGVAFRVGSAPEEFGVAGGGAGGVQVAGAEEVGAAVAHFRLQLGQNNFSQF